MPEIPPVTDRDHTLGPAEAAHTLVHYGDLECPFSRQVHLLVDNVRAVFPDSVRFVFRHFPLRIHENALRAAEAAEAAAAQGAFWPFHNRLLENQLDLTERDLIAHAKAVGLDGREVKTALRKGVFRDKVLDHKRAAVATGVDSSLNLAIDGVMYQEDDLEDALIEQVVRPLKAAQQR